MTNGQLLGMVGLLLFYAAIGLGLLVGVCLLVNQAVYWVEGLMNRRALRAGKRRADELEHALGLPKGQLGSCNVYRLHPATVDEIRPRRGDAA